MNFELEKMINDLKKDIIKENVHMSDIVAILDEIDKLDNKIELYQDFIPRIIDHIDGFTLLSYIYNKNELDNYTMYLFHKKLVNLSEPTNYMYSYILNNKPWGLNFILKNIDEISETKMLMLVSFCQTRNELYSIFLSSFNDRKKRNLFLTNALHYSLYKFDDKDIINTLYSEDICDYEQLSFFELRQKPTIIKSIIAQQICIMSNYKDLLEKHGEELFESEKTKKMLLLSLLSEKYEYLKEKYKIGLMLYNRSCNSYKTDLGISSIINYGNYEEFCKEFIEKFPNDNIRAISLSTQTSDVFASNDHIFKTGIDRFNNEMDLNFFRIIPSSITYIKDESNKVVSVYEFQNIVDTNESHITDEMIYELFLDFKKHNKFVHDPNCLTFKKENFGLLKNYKEANLGTYNSHEELPEHFKKHPLVLLDTDLVYEYGSIIKPPELPLSTYLNMDSAIKNYEEAKKYIKK